MSWTTVFQSWMHLPKSYLIKKRGLVSCCACAEYDWATSICCVCLSCSTTWCGLQTKTALCRNAWGTSSWKCWYDKKPCIDKNPRVKVMYISFHEQLKKWSHLVDTCVEPNFPACLFLSISPRTSDVLQSRIHYKHSQNKTNCGKMHKDMKRYYMNLTFHLLPQMFRYKFTVKYQRFFGRIIACLKYETWIFTYSSGYSNC